uniref:Uncharacterized protein n=1 Tax=Knipowitschia caucasica TaxID=637954 RepID=A0AAV2JSC4_KNICA
MGLGGGFLLGYIGVCFFLIVGCGGVGVLWGVCVLVVEVGGLGCKGWDIVWCFGGGGVCFVLGGWFFGRGLLGWVRIVGVGVVGRVMGFGWGGVGFVCGGVYGVFVVMVGGVLEFEGWGMWEVWGVVMLDEGFLVIWLGVVCWFVGLFCFGGYGRVWVYWFVWGGGGEWFGDGVGGVFCLWWGMLGILWELVSWFGFLLGLGVVEGCCCGYGG